MPSSETKISGRTATELRRAFLDFFEKRGHAVVPSSPLVPMGDPTLLFTTAGMVQFKPYYTTSGDVPYTRAVSVQKSLRLTDIERVGLTPRHDTFFEMLGNFSFGPREKGAYFKEEAVVFAWEFVTEVLALPRERLYASIFAGEEGLPRDDEAEVLWKKVGLPADRIVALGRADNFWGPAGGQGPCGPCSEIYFDLGEKPPADFPATEFWGERPGDPGDRYMEFWNLVFPQFDAQPGGGLTPLLRPGIDTGMGLERLALIMQGKLSIFDTDLFAPLLDTVLGLSRGTRTAQVMRDARIIADHVRALVFAIGEGAMPGNEGAGYVLRRLLRRAVTRGRSRSTLGIDRTFLPKVAARAIEQFGDHYAELRDHRDRILRVLEQEEAGFVQTYEAGMSRLEALLAPLELKLPDRSKSPPSRVQTVVSGQQPGQPISGEEAFELHDTYGFPIELTEEIASERGIAVDREGFERAMDEQRRRAREKSKFKKGDETRAAWTEVTPGADSRFVGYDTLIDEGLTLRYWRAGAAGEVELVLDRTPCYAESGGQVADRGVIDAGDATGELTHVYKEDDRIVHRVRLARGAAQDLVAAGARGALAARVDPAHRRPTQRHHTATHLLHAILREVLGTHVRQAGSLVAPDRLRFDYTHFEHPSRQQLEAIERLVNEWILLNPEVTWKVMPIEQARALGAMALFGEKYGSEVRVVTVAGAPEAEIPTSRELCGGTHVGRAGDIGTFTIVSDSAIASGVRRIEALTGHEALTHLKREADLLARAAAALQTSPAQLVEQVEKLKVENERLKKAQADLQRGGLEAEMMRLAESAVSAPQGVFVVAELAADAGTDAVRDAADRLRARLGRGAAVLALKGEGKLMFLAVVTDDLIAEKRLRADELVRAVAKVTGGSGGGKPHLALAGGKDMAKLADAMAEARRLVEQGLA